MNVQVRTIKKMLLKEYEQLYQDTYRAVRKEIISDACLEMVSNGYYQGKSLIENASTYDELDGALSFCGYRMSLQEWLDSY